MAENASGIDNKDASRVTESQGIINLGTVDEASAACPVVATRPPVPPRQFRQYSDSAATPPANYIDVGGTSDKDDGLSGSNCATRFYFLNKVLTPADLLYQHTVVLTLICAAWTSRLIGRFFEVLLRILENPLGAISDSVKKLYAIRIKGYWFNEALGISRRPIYRLLCINWGRWEVRKCGCCFFHCFA
ncbi:hypothetical protein CHUAL_002400 [Chamberlinius hualienensis]